MSGKKDHLIKPLPPYIRDDARILRRAYCGECQAPYCTINGFGYCPRCFQGWHQDKKILLWGNERSLSILGFLAHRLYASEDELIEHLWPNPDMQPDRGGDIISVYVCKARKTFKPFLNVYAHQKIWCLEFYKADEIRQAA